MPKFVDSGWDFSVTWDTSAEMQNSSVLWHDCGLYAMMETWIINHSKLSLK